MNHVEGGDAHWEYATSVNGPFTSFDPSANNLGYGTYYLRYAVINACDEAYSNVVSFNVDAAPEALMQLSGMHNGRWHRRRTVPTPPSTPRWSCR